MLNLDTTVAEYVAFIKARYPCLEGIEKLESFADKVATIKDITTYLNEGKSTWNPQWTYWTLVDHGDQMSTEVQALFLRRITNPKAALRLYKELPWLTDAMDFELQIIFEGVLPDAESLLADGTEVRAKDG